ncbi:MAG: 2'-5' RNA ligase family protein [Thermoleophilia bacterium]|nr:2'-5' RNA ligase family protein [Thermoleophilia bacterium]
MAHHRWYWGVVIRVDSARELLSAIADAVDGENVRAQDPRTGHITLFYAPLRGRRDGPELAERVRAVIAVREPFSITCSGFGEFASATRPVAWLGVQQGAEAVLSLRESLCTRDQDCHHHAYVPHLTLAYGEEAAAYTAVRETLREHTGSTACTTRVDAVWIAGFPQNGHPARDLRYVERIPFAGQ